MSENVIKDHMGRILGTVRTDSRGVQTLRDAVGQILGTYDPRTNKTRNSLGQIVGEGNLLSMLFVR